MLGKLAVAPDVRSAWDVASVRHDLMAFLE
jgi:hypothetical protein